MGLPTIAMNMKDLRGVCACALAAVFLVSALVASTPVVAGALAFAERDDGSEPFGALLAQLQELATQPAIAGAAQEIGNRHALVIGIDDYAHLDSLLKAENDAVAVSEALGALGFRVTLETGLGVDAFDAVLAEFYNQLSPDDTAVFFFAGHGVADGGTNYLLPADMPRLDTTENPRLSRNAIDANEVLAEIRARGVNLALVILDACRDDPFAHDGTRGGRAITRGLARIQPEQGAFVIYSAGVGQTALDRLAPADPDPNSVFTRKFRPILETPGLPLVEIAKRTQVEVRALAETVRHPQAPAYYDQVIGQFYFKPPAPRIFGLSIGIDAYVSENLVLGGAVNDARNLHDALMGVGATEVTLITDRDARRQFISFAWQQMVARAAPGDTLVLTFAGQSFAPRIRSDDGDEKRSMLLLAEARLDDTAMSAYASDEANEEEDWIAHLEQVITARDMTEWMEMAAARNLNVVVFVDGCHAGGMLLREFSNVTFIAATDIDGLAMEKTVDGQQQGIASAAFAEALMGAADSNGDGLITRSELFAWIDARVAVLSANRDRAPQQRPEIQPDPRSAGFVDLPLFTTPQDPALKQRAEVVRLSLLDDLAARTQSWGNVRPLRPGAVAGQTR